MRRLATAFVLAATLAPPAAAWDPPGWQAPPAAERDGPVNPATTALRWFLQAYRATVSRVDGDRCPSQPTCSSFALQAVTQHGAVLGAVLTAGRLLGEADEAGFAPRIWIDGRWKVYAPLADDLAFLRGRLDP